MVDSLRLIVAVFILLAIISRLRLTVGQNLRLFLTMNHQLSTIHDFTNNITLVNFTKNKFHGKSKGTKEYSYK